MENFNFTNFLFGLFISKNNFKLLTSVFPINVPDTFSISIFIIFLPIPDDIKFFIVPQATIFGSTSL